MSDAEAEKTEPKKGKIKKLLTPMVTLLLGGAGFAITYLGLIPLPSAEHGAAAEAAVPKVVFVDVPTIQVPVPGSRNRSVIVSATIETSLEEQAEIKHLMPRVSDVFTSFLTNVDAGAYERRGALEIIRSELVTRTRYVLGDEAVHDLLITEFRVK